MKKAKIYSALLKIDKISCWILFVLMILFIISGYSLIGKYGMQSLMDRKTALLIHINLSELLVFFFILHSGIRIYFAVKRWQGKKVKK
jgi:cytochrome b subunit of formate dehydrogenase